MKSPKGQFSERINRAYPRLTQGDRRIADHLLRTYPTGLLENASAIAQTLGLHVSTVTRFFPKIGYASIRAANQDVRGSLDFLMASPMARVRDRGRTVTRDTALFHEVERLDLKNIQDTFRELSYADVRRFMQLVVDPARSVYVFGARKHFSLCFYTFIQLNGVRDNVFLAPTGNFYVADLLARVRAGDVLWLFDFRRYPRLSIKVAEYFKNVGGQVVLVTDSALAPVGALRRCEVHRGHARGVVVRLVCGGRLAGQRVSGGVHPADARIGSGALRTPGGALPALRCLYLAREASKRLGPGDGTGPAGSQGKRTWTCCRHLRQAASDGSRGAFRRGIAAGPIRRIGGRRKERQ